MIRLYRSFLKSRMCVFNFESVGRRFGMRLEFFLTDFVRCVDGAIFNQYLESRSLPSVEMTGDDEENIEAMVEVVESAGEEKSQEIIIELSIVRELATEDGIVSICGVAEDENLLGLYLGNDF